MLLSRRGHRGGQRQASSYQNRDRSGEESALCSCMHCVYRGICQEKALLDCAFCHECICMGCLSLGCRFWGCYVAHWLKGVVSRLHDANLPQMGTPDSACQMCMQAQDSESQGDVSGRDLLSLLLEEKREDGTPSFSQREVHDEVLVMLPLQNRIQIGTHAMLYSAWYHCR